MLFLKGLFNEFENIDLKFNFGIGGGKGGFFIGPNFNGDKAI